MTISPVNKKKTKRQDGIHSEVKFAFVVFADDDSIDKCLKFADREDVCLITSLYEDEGVLAACLKKERETLYWLFK